MRMVAGKPWYTKEDNHFNPNRTWQCMENDVFTETQYTMNVIGWGKQHKQKLLSVASDGGYFICRNMY